MSCENSHEDTQEERRIKQLQTKQSHKEPQNICSKMHNDHRDAQEDYKETKTSTKRNKTQLQTEQENHRHSKHPH